MGSYVPCPLDPLGPGMGQSVFVCVSGAPPSQVFFLRTPGCAPMTHSRGLMSRRHIYIYIYIFIYLRLCRCGGAAVFIVTGDA